MNKRRRWKAKARRKATAAAVRRWMGPATYAPWRPSDTYVMTIEGLRAALMDVHAALARGC